MGPFCAEPGTGFRSWTVWIPLSIIATTTPVPSRFKFHADCAFTAPAVLLRVEPSGRLGDICSTSLSVASLARRDAGIEACKDLTKDKSVLTTPLRASILLRWTAAGATLYRIMTCLLYTSDAA